MKLVELLAKEIDVWPEDFVAITQDDGFALYGWRLEGAEFRDGAWFSPEDDDCGMSDLDMPDPQQQASDHDESIVTRAQWQAERDRQNGGEWKRHRGGKQPVADNVTVDVKFSDGTQRDGEFAEHWEWRWEDADPRINKYRISQPQAEEVEVKDTTIGTLSYKVEIDTTEATQAIDELAAKWDQIETPFKWRDEVTELNAYIEEYTRERDALIERLASEGFALIQKINVNLDKIDATLDMSDWRNWKAGDVLESMEQSMDIELGGQYILSEDPFNEGDITFRDDAGDIRGRHADEYKFIRRP